MDPQCNLYLKSNIDATCENSANLESDVVVTPLVDSDSPVKNDIVEKIIAMNANNRYQVELVPLSFNIRKNLDHIENNTIFLKIEKSKQIKAYVVHDGKMTGPYFNLGLTASELNVLNFPQANEDHVVIQYDEFPELIDKLSMRCGIHSEASVIGRSLATIFSLGCGITTVAAYFKLLFASAITLTPVAYAGAAVIGISAFIANYRKRQFDLPQVLVTGYNYLFYNRYLKKDENGNRVYEAKSLPSSKLFLLGFGAVCSFFLGVAFAVLTYTATINLPLAFTFLVPYAPVLPVFGIILGGATLISLSFIMFKATSDLLKNDELVASLKKIRDNLFHF